jgi:hypothetical protein
MNLKRSFGTMGIVGVCWLVAAGCGDDESKKTSDGDGGEAGDTGRGGSQGGSSNNGGTAGGGKAGANVGGQTGGAGGDSADAGMAGMTAGGIAGEAAAGTNMGGDSGAAGDAGAAGSGGESGGPPTAKQCGYACEDQTDCMATEFSFTCHPTQKQCVECVADADCYPMLSFWFSTCTGDQDCAEFGELCVDANGEGWCAPPPDSEGGGCIFGEPSNLPKFAAAGNVEVCVYLNGSCSDGRCEPGCEHPQFGGCEAGQGNTCDPVSGLCTCANSDECTANGVSVCNPTTSLCECFNDDDCAETSAQTGHGVCVNGKCGCAGADTCVDSPFAGATVVCE